MLEVFKNEISHLSVSKNISERYNCNHHNDKSHLLNTGLTTIPKKCLIITLLESFYKMANLDLKFGFTTSIIRIFCKRLFFLVV